MSYWRHNQITDHYLKTLSMSAGYMGQVLAGMLDEDDQWGISRDRLREKTGRSCSTISKAMKELVAQGVFIATRRDSRKATVYVSAMTCPADCEKDSHRPYADEGPQLSTREDVESVPSNLRTPSPSNLRTPTPSNLLTTYKPKNKPTNKQKKIDPRTSGITILKTQLAALVDSGWGAGDYAPTNNYSNPLEELTEAIRVDSDGVEKKLKKKTTTAENLTPYILQLLKTNPWILLPDYWSDRDSEPAKTSPPEARRAPKTSSVGTSAPTPIQPAHRPPLNVSMSAANADWLGFRPTEYQIRCAMVADELGFTIPQGVDAPQVGQLLAAARDMVAAGEVLENPTSEQWHGRAPLKSHRVKVSG